MYLHKNAPLLFGRGAFPLLFRGLGQKGLSLRRFQNLQYSLPHQSLEGITFQQRAEYGAAIIFTIVTGLRHNGRGGRRTALGMLTGSSCGKAR